MLDSKGSFSDWLHSYNKGSNGVDTGRDGKLLPTVRATDKTVHGKLWKKLGRNFTDEDQKVFNNRDITEQEHTLSDSEIDAYIHNDNEGRQELNTSSLDSPQ